MARPKGFMSNYIFNDSLSGIESQAVNTVAAKNKNPIPKLIAVCTALTASIIIVLAAILAFNALSNALDKNGAPRVTNNTSYISKDDGKLSTAENSDGKDDAFSAMKSTVVSISSKTGASGSGVIAGEFEDSNGKHGYYIITCASTITGNRSGLPTLISEITLENGEVYDASLCGVDSTVGIAVLKFYEDERIFSCVKWASSDAHQPSGIIILGGAGGGVFNLNGELVGISTDEKIENINFIPSSVAFEAYERLTALQYERKII